VIKYQHFFRTNVQFQDFSGHDFSVSKSGLFKTSGNPVKCNCWSVHLKTILYLLCTTVYIINFFHTIELAVTIPKAVAMKYMLHTTLYQLRHGRTRSGLSQPLSSTYQMLKLKLAPHDCRGTVHNAILFTTGTLCMADTSTQSTHARQRSLHLTITTAVYLA